MSCEKYRKTIAEALALGEELAPSVRSHVDGCAGCRTVFAEEQALLTAIDKGIRDAVDCEVPGSFHAVVRARIREESMPKPHWVPTWAAVAVSAALILGIVVVQNARHSGPNPNPKQPALVKNSSPTEIGPLPNGSPRLSGPKITRGRGSRRAQSPSSVLVADVRPLIPADQRQAVDQLISRLQRGELKGEILLRAGWGGQIEDLQISPIEVPPLPATDEGSRGIN